MSTVVANVELLRLVLVHREEIVETLEGILNALRKVRSPEPSLLARQFEECFSGAAGQLEAAYCASGFKPRRVEGISNDLIDPAELMLRGVYCWQQTHWPGRGGRRHYAHTLFNLYVLRCLQFLSLRIWEDSGGLAEIQSVLDALWKTSPAGQPALMRDARWLIPMAQSLITDELAPYFDVAEQVTQLPEADACEIWRAHVRMLGGHLTSQIRHYCTRDGLPMDEPSVVLRTRNSNALDFALLVQGLVVLLHAYGEAVQSGDERKRLEMAGAIWQGISADPELFLHRFDLLSAYSMIEHVFIDGLGYSLQGQRHVRLLKEYRALMVRLIEALREDFPSLRPAAGAYSPYGVIFGLPSHLIEHMALKAIQFDAEGRFSLEDVFADDPNPAKLAWVNGWRRVPHIPAEVQRQYDYPQQFAEEVYGRIERELNRDAPRTGRLYVESGEIPELPASYLFTSDNQNAAQFLAGRQEGYFLVSYETANGWTALKKDLLTEVLGAGRDARIDGLPSSAAQVLRLMCAAL